MKKILFTLLIFLITLTAFSQKEEYDDIYYQPSKDIVYDTTEINKNYNLLIDETLNLEVNNSDYNSLSDYTKSQAVRYVVEDFQWNPHKYWGSYLWKLNHNYHMGYISYMDYQLYYDLMYWDSWYYNDFYYNNYYSYRHYNGFGLYLNYNRHNNWNYAYNYRHHINKPKQPVRQRTITQRPVKQRSTYTQTPRNRSNIVNRKDNRVYSKVLPRENNRSTRYDRPKTTNTVRSTQTRRPTQTYNRNSNSRNSYTTPRSNTNRSSTTVRSSGSQNRGSSTVRSSGSSGTRSSGNSSSSRSSGSSRSGGRR